MINCFHHFRKDKLNFVPAASSQECDYRYIFYAKIFVHIVFRRKLRDSLFCLIHKWIPLIFNSYTKLFVKINLEGEDDEHAIDVPPDLNYPFLIPCPKFRRYVIKGPVSGLFCKLCNSEIETRIIDKDYNIWF